MLGITEPFEPSRSKCGKAITFLRTHMWGCTRQPAPQSSTRPGGVGHDGFLRKIEHQSSTRRTGAPLVRKGRMTVANAIASCSGYSAVSLLLKKPSCRRIPTTDSCVPGGWKQDLAQVADRRPVGYKHPGCGPVFAELACTCLRCKRCNNMHPFIHHGIVPRHGC